MTIKKVTQWTLLVIVLAAPVRAAADIVVDIGDLSLSPGSSGFVPIRITGNGGESLNDASVEFNISTAGVTWLQFTNSPGPATDPTFASPDYVFWNNSGDQMFDISLGTASTTSVPFDTFLGGDFTANGGDVDITTSNFLLGYLPVSTLLALPGGPVAQVGDSFIVTLVAGDNTSFFGSSGGPYTFSSNVGTVSVVPEPSSWLLATWATLAVIYVKARRRQIPSSKVDTFVARISQVRIATRDVLVDVEPLVQK